LLKAGDQKIVIGDTLQQYPVKCESNPEPGTSGWRTEYIQTTDDQLPASKCEANPEPGTSGWRTEYMQTTDDRLPASEEELFGSYPNDVVGTKFSQNIYNSYALDMKTGYPACGMGDSQGTMTGNSGRAVGQSLVLKYENSDSAVGQTLEIGLKTEDSESDCAMGQSLVRILKTENSDHTMRQSQSLEVKTEISDGESNEVKTELEEFSCTDSMQIKIEPGSMRSFSVKYEENEMYDTQPVVLNIENEIKTETKDLVAEQEPIKIDGEYVQLDSRVGMLDSDSDNVVAVSILSVLLLMCVLVQSMYLSHAKIIEVL
jgi:hypothetical protein